MIQIHGRKAFVAKLTELLLLSYADACMLRVCISRIGSAEMGQSLFLEDYRLCYLIISLVILLLA